MNAPDISVILVSYDRPEQLATALQSLTLQSLPQEQFEVIVIDNGPNSETERVCRDRLQRFRSGRFYRESKPGAAAARNRAIREAIGRILVFLDDDIVASPELLEQHANTHRVFPESAILGNVKLPWESPRTAWQQALAEHPELFQSFDFLDPHDVPFNYFYTCNLSIERSFFDKNPWFDESFASSGFEDIELGYRFSMAGNRIIYNPRAAGLHDVRTSFRRFREKRYNSGRWLSRMLMLHPEARSSLLPSNWSSFRFALGKLATGAAALYEAKSPQIIRKVLAKGCWLSWQTSFWSGYQSAEHALARSPRSQA